MPERFVLALKIVCLCLAAVVLVQFSRLASGKDPLQNLRIPAALISRSASTNAPAATAAPAPAGTATNSLANQPAEPRTTNAIPQSSATKPPGRSMVPGLRGGPPQPELNLPPAIRTRVERITQSEILGPIIRPMPMALLGIGGTDAFLRAPNGQTGLLKVGEELGGLKLLRIGTNRVLVEHEGQKKELMIFSGLGSETLLIKEKEKPQ